ncbi:terminase large subunit [Aureimonas mangrovi]|uniref:terminase large subunit n=1 Tax=Aureimonas mangrovi TaxID=2758041 RepID=UPI00163D7C8A|nr:terminase TerL endonuclease subunit [Aureimonas mangrovi]
MAKSSHPHVDAAHRYARDVVAGKILACKWVRLACQRHLDDLKAAKAKAYPYRFDPGAAEKWCRFIELLPHTKGKWAQQAQKLKLEPWQCFKTACLFGWLRKADELRRFRKALILEPRKNAKSTWAAGVGLGMLTLDGEHGAEVYSGATTEKQAWEVFRPARLMAMKTPSLLSAFGVQVNASNLHIIGNGSRFEPVIGNPGDGASPSCAIIDEYHEHQTDTQVDTMETGMGAREQPLLLIITTAGDNLAGPCFSLLQDAQKVLEGVWQNDELFALIYTVDADDDWTSEAALRKANPNFDVSVSGEFLKARQKDAIQNARRVGVFKTKHLNMWVQARNAYFNVQRWSEAADPLLKLEDFAGQPARVSLDLASKVDVAAMEILIKLAECRDCPVAERLIDEGREFVRFGRYYLPEATIALPENEHYRGWHEKGLIVETDGDMIDFAAIEGDILSLPIRVDEVVYDPWQAAYLITRLQEQGLTCVEMRATVQNFSEPMKTMEGLIRSRKIAHDGDPVFLWMLSNTVAKEDAKDNVYPRKDRPENKIDGVVAHIGALARFVTGAEEAGMDWSDIFSNVVSA